MSIEAMKQWLEALEYRGDYRNKERHTKRQNAITSLRQAIEQADKQEPVAWRTPNWGHGPDEWAYFDADDRPTGANGPTGEALYTTPQPQREWVGLTDEEYSHLHNGLYQQGQLLGWVVDEIEAKLKEKNT